MELELAEMTLQERVAELIKQHGGLRAAALAIQVDHVYLWRMLRGTKVNPSSRLLRRMGIKKVVNYERTT